MKLSEVEIGGRYRAKVSGRLSVVRVTELKECSAYARGRRSKTVIYAVNEATGRAITIRSPQRLRSLAMRGCEFCRHACNRTAGTFSCPYCGRVWT